MRSNSNSSGNSKGGGTHHNSTRGKKHDRRRHHQHRGNQPRHCAYHVRRGTHWAFHRRHQKRDFRTPTFRTLTPRMTLTRPCTYARDGRTHCSRSHHTRMPSPAATWESPVPYCRLTPDYAMHSARAATDEPLAGAARRSPLWGGWRAAAARPPPLWGGGRAVGGGTGSWVGSDRVGPGRTGSLVTGSGSGLRVGVRSGRDVGPLRSGAGGVRGGACPKE